MIRLIVTLLTLASAAAHAQSIPAPQPEPGAKPQRTIVIRASGNLAAQWTAGPIEAPTGEVTLARGDFLFRQPVVPASAIRLSEAVKAKNGAELIPAGTVLASVATFAPAWCWFTKDVADRHDGRVPCILRLTDEEGRADQMFWAQASFGELPAVRDGIPRLEELSPAVAFTRADPNAFATGLFYGPKFVGWRGFPGMGPLINHISGPAGDIQVVGGLTVRRKDAPKTIEADGAKVTVHAWDDATLRATVERAYQNPPIRLLAQPPTMIFVPPVRY